MRAARPSAVLEVGFIRWIGYCCMPMKMTETQVRVLGVLIEKSLTHPGSYPLTLNAIVLGAGQKQNRCPVESYTETAVGKALYSLQEMDLVAHAPPAPGARANRFQHRAVETFHWDPREQAVMAELMLRGRETAGELRTRASRMTPFDDLEAVGAVLAGLMEHEPAFVAQLSREPGRSATRFRHLLSGEEAGVSDMSSEAVTQSPTPEPHDDQPGLADRVARLEARVSELSRVVADLRQNAMDCVDVDTGSTL